MELVPGSERIQAAQDASPTAGGVCWAPTKSLWIGSLTLAAVVAGPLTFTWDALVLFLATSAVTLCFGHSVGMHRRLIHSSFSCPRWVEYLCVYLGTLVGNRSGHDLGLRRISRHTAPPVQAGAGGCDQQRPAWPGAGGRGG